MIITIDGPAATGKSTTARLLAEQLNFYYLNSGLLYRALTYILVHNGDYTDRDLKNVTIEVAQNYLNNKRFTYSYDTQHGAQITFDNKNITSLLKTPEIDRFASTLSQNKHAREAITQLQKTIAQQHDSVIEGRDVGSVVFPHTDIKFFLTASDDVRAQRWQKDQKKKGKEFTFEQARQELLLRDKKDIEREVAPLIIPEGATIIDNSELSLQETLDALVKEVSKKIRQ